MRERLLRGTAPAAAPEATPKARAAKAGKRPAAKRAPRKG
jgi:hypothetical protein